MWDGFHIIISLLMFPAFSFICILRVLKKNTTITTFGVQMNMSMGGRNLGEK